MTIRLMNSAMMPQAGTYHLRRVTPNEWAHIVRQGKWISYIGYDATAAHVSRLIGQPVPVSREQTTLDDGDILAIARLRYRVAPERKGALAPDPADYEYFVARYSTGEQP